MAGKRFDLEGGRARTFAGGAALALVAAGLAVPAQAYIGESYVQIPGINGGAKDKAHAGWVRAEANYWKSEEGGMFGGGRFGGRAGFRQPRTWFNGPLAPLDGPSGLVVSVDKKSPAYKSLMAKCRTGASLGDIRFSESSEFSRGGREVGPRPVQVAPWYDYALKNAKITDCPVAADAPEQAFVLSFADIDWLNYTYGSKGFSNMLKPAALRTLSLQGATKTWVVHWQAVANDVSDDQCPVMNKRPEEDEFYTYMTPAQAAKEKAERAKNGGVHFENGEMERRGPGMLNAALLPGTVKPTPLAIPQTRFARGLDLDGNAGTGKAAAGTCKHRNYESIDGRKGIDNQMFTVEGCMAGHQGHKGFLMQYRNTQRRNGGLAVLIQLSGLDDERNDGDVDVTVLYSKDPMGKNAAGTQILPDFTFRLTDDPEYGFYFTQLKGHIRDGVLETDTVDLFRMHGGNDPETILYQSRMRLDLMPDGSLKGIVAGYEDWHKQMNINANSNSEFHYGYSVPAMYAGFRQYADGLKDPVTGQCNGVSAAYDIEAVPAFIPPRQTMALFGGKAGVR